jgi:hypothetical protein
MLNPDLLELALKDFSSFDAAIRANIHSPRDREIRWVEALPELVTRDRSIGRLETVQTTHHSLVLERLPNGMWTWVPTHPDDVAIVAEHRERGDKSAAQYFVQTIELNGMEFGQGGNEDYKQHLIDQAKRNLAEKLVELFEDGKDYKTSLKRHDGVVRDQYGFLNIKIQFRITVCRC